MLESEDADNLFPHIKVCPVGVMITAKKEGYIDTITKVVIDEKEVFPEVFD